MKLSSRVIGLAACLSLCACSDDGDGGGGAAGGNAGSAGHGGSAGAAGHGGAAGSAGSAGAAGSAGHSGSAGAGATGGGGSGGGPWSPPGCSRCPDPAPLTQPAGSVEVTLVPSADLSQGSRLISFGAPFPRGAVAEVGLVRVLRGGSELPSKITELARWRSLTDSSQPGALRAALVQVEVDVSETTQLTLEWGVRSTQTLDTSATAFDAWLPISGGEDPTEYPSAAAIQEPPVYAVFPAAWLSDAGLRSFTAPVGQVTSLSGYDASFVGSAHTAVNDLDPQVTARINVTEYEPWLFDRAMTLWSVYARTGDVKWLRRAHRATQFYAAHLGNDGTFDLRAGDLKYAYGQSMFVALMLTGDTRLLPKIEAVATAQTSWNPLYRAEMNFWTERHQAYALLGALSAWEATGAASHATRAREIVEASLTRIQSPVEGWANDDCILHQNSDHEGVSTHEPVCSPWMSALLTDAVWRYYIHARDEASLEVLAALGRFVVRHGLYDGSGEGVAHPVPHYLASSVYQFTDGGAWADWEHTCDVAGLVAKGLWASRALGNDTATLEGGLSQLLAGCAAVLDYWHRPAGPASGLAEWRLSPPRKFNWWFGTTADLPYFLR